MTRAEITKMLGDLLLKQKLRGKYWASEVTFFWGTEDECRVDFMKFEPVNQSASGVERGMFSCYEVKSCLADYRSKYGHNHLAEKNYYVMPMEVYKKIATEKPYSIGIYCPIPYGRTVSEEFENPTPMEDIDVNRVNLESVVRAIAKDRKVSNIVCLFNMFRSGH